MFERLIKGWNHANGEHEVGVFAAPVVIGGAMPNAQALGGSITTKLDPRCGEGRQRRGQKRAFEFPLGLRAYLRGGYLRSFRWRL